MNPTIVPLSVLPVSRIEAPATKSALSPAPGGG